MDNNTATYTVVGGATNGCDSIVTLDLTMSTNIGFDIDLGQDTSICNGPVLLTPGTGFNSYLWSNGSSSSSIIVSEEGSYTVIVTNLNGCEGTDTIEVQSDCDFAIYVPNVFTPNGDGINDLFRVVSVNLESIEVLIFNRWGQLISQWNTNDGYWDGKTNSGKYVPEGTYVYIVEYSYYGGAALIRANKKGHVTLIR